METCSLDTVQTVKQKIVKAVKLISLFRWIIDAYVSDFFTSDHWSRLPSCYREFLHNKDPPDLAFFLDKEQSSREIPPLSLLALQKCITTVSLERREVHSIGEEIFHTSGCHGDTYTEDQSNDSRVEGSAKEHIKDGQYLLLDSSFRKHVKPKKQHEIVKLAQVIKVLGDHSGCQNVVDIGAGQGHLSRLLALGYGFKVTTVEAADCHASKAKKFDRDAQVEINRAQRKRKQQSMSTTDAPFLIESTVSDNPSTVLPDHVTCLIEPNTTAEKFLTIVQDSLKREPAYRADVMLDKNDEKHLDKNSCQNATGTKEKYTIQGGQPESGACSRGSRIDCKCSMLRTSDYSTVRQPHGSGSCDSPANCKCHMVRDSDGNNARQFPGNVDCLSGSFTNSNHCLSTDSDSSTVRKFILTGLHACGDLTPTMLRVFAKCSDVGGLASVACCYMKLTCQDADTSSCTGYPMSDFVRQMSDSYLSYEAREMACHFVDSYKDRLLDNPPNLKLHCYRAALQYIIKKKCPYFSHGCIKLTVRHAEKLSFEKYAEMGLKRLGIDENIEADLLQQAESYLADWKNVVAFYTLRLCLAPVVETLILLDRMMFLYEKGFQSSLIPIFDPKLSPRNFVLVASKD